MPKLYQNSDGIYYTITKKQDFVTYHFNSTEMIKYNEKYKLKIGDELPHRWWDETNNFRYIEDKDLRKTTRSDSGILYIYNAKCPVCKKLVFFYQNEFGSRVFFDSVGVPWPQHPCTISNKENIIGEKKELNTQDSNSLKAFLSTARIQGKKTDLQNSDIVVRAKKYKITPVDDKKLQRLKAKWQRQDKRKKRQENLDINARKPKNYEGTKCPHCGKKFNSPSALKIHVYKGCAVKK